MPDITEMVNGVIAEDQGIRDQLALAKKEMYVFLDMLNINLQRKGAYCNSYTMTVASGLCDENTSYMRH